MLATWGCSTFPKPTLSLDFAGATSLDSGITFSRGSQATLFDSTGTLRYAANNLLNYSQEFNNGYWVKSGATAATDSTTAPDGTLTADSLLETATTARHGFVGSNGTISLSATRYAYSCYIKANGRTAASLTLSRNTTNLYAVATFDLAGVAVTQTGAVGTGFAYVSSSITAVGDGWYRCVLVCDVPAATNFFAGIYASDATTFTPDSVGGVNNYAGDSSKGLFVWGAQLEIGSTANAYNVTVASAYYAPRFDYNPSTLQPLGLLIEEARTNLFPASNDFANATYWSVFGTAVATAGAGTGPDGLNSAVNLAGATDITLSGNNIEEVITVSASTAYEFSVFVKSSGGTTVTLRLRDSTGGSSSSSPFTVTSSWTRISLNRTMAAGATSVRCIIGATNGDILIYGAQLEAGAFATSYIPTTTTALTRNADVATMTGTNFSSWYNASQGTILANTTVLAVAPSTALQSVFAINDGTADNRMAVYKRANADVSTRFDVTAATINSCFLNAGTFTTTNRIAAAYATDNFAAVLNGGSPATDTGGAVPTVTQINIGSYVGATSFLNGHIQRLAYYPTRLPNATLQALTA